MKSSPEKKEEVKKSLPEEKGKISKSEKSFSSLKKTDKSPQPSLAKVEKTSKDKKKELIPPPPPPPPPKKRQEFKYADWKKPIPRDSRLWIQQDRPEDEEERNKTFQESVGYFRRVPRLNDTLLDRIAERKRPFPYRPLKRHVEDALRHGIGFVPTIDPLEVVKQPLASSSEASGRDRRGNSDTESDSTCSLMTRLSCERGRHKALSDSEGDRSRVTQLDNVTDISKLLKVMPKKISTTESVMMNEDELMEKASHPFEYDDESVNARRELLRARGLVTNPDILKDFEDCFIFFDRKNRRSIDVSYLPTMLRAMGQFWTSSELDDLVNQKFGGRKSFKMEEWLFIAAQRYADVPNGPDLINAFKTFDRLNKDFVETPFLKHALQNVSDKMTKDEIKELWHLNSIKDEQQDLSLADFVKLFMGPRVLRYPEFKSVT